MRLSIIMPFYNKEEKIVRLAIESVLAQTEKDLELLCVNDASPGKSGDFLYEMAKNDERLKVFTHEKNKGVSAARNTALQAAAGDYIGFVDADDMVATNYYEVMLKAAEFTQADIVSSTFQRIEYDHTKAEKVDFAEKQLKKYRPAKKHYCLKARSIWNRIYKRELLKGITFVDGLNCFEDLVFLNIAVSRAKTMFDINFDGYLYRHCNPEIFKSAANVPAKKPIEQKSPVFPVYLTLHNRALAEIMDLVKNGCDDKTAKAMTYLVLRRFLRIVFQVRKGEPEMRDLCYNVFAEFFETKIYDIGRKGYPVFCSAIHKCFARKKFDRIFILKIQTLRLMMEIAFFLSH